MPARARLVRNLSATALIVGLVAGTVVWQTDDTWPLAQMRMFPGGSESAISLVVIEARLADGRTRLVNPFEFHLKCADLEGQMDRVRADPEMLGDLAERYNQTVSPERRIVAITLIRRVTARAGGSVDLEPLVRWSD